MLQEMSREFRLSNSNIRIVNTGSNVILEDQTTGQRYQYILHRFNDNSNNNSNNNLNNDPN